MLVLTRKLGEDVVGELDEECLRKLLAQVKATGQPIRITMRVLEVRSGQVKTGWEADESISIHRREIQNRVDEERRQSGAAAPTRDDEGMQPSNAAPQS